MTPADLAELITPDLEPWVPCRNADPELWFPERRGRSESPEYAVALCYGCPILDACRDVALNRRVMGIWGGTTERQRDALMRRNWSRR